MYEIARGFENTPLPSQCTTCQPDMMHFYFLPRRILKIPIVYLGSKFNFNCDFDIQRLCYIRTWGVAASVPDGHTCPVRNHLNLTTLKKCKFIKKYIDAKLKKLHLSEPHSQCLPMPLENPGFGYAAVPDLRVNVLGSFILGIQATWGEG